MKTISEELISEGTCGKYMYSVYQVEGFSIAKDKINGALDEAILEEMPPPIVT